jgi:hypothetical protein
MDGCGSSAKQQSDVQSGRAGLGFLGLGPFGRENPGLWGLERLGFPWILSSESNLFNGLRRIFAERNFSSPFAAAPEPWNGRPAERDELVMGKV